MQVILLERVEKLGAMGEVVRVKDGFARNFLLPKGKALRATQANRERFERDREALEARNAEQRRRAQRAYLKLNRAAFRAVEPGGFLATSSCTSQISPEAFQRLVAEAAQAAGVRAQLVAERGQPLDHPVPASFPEGRYLKFLVYRVLPG